MSDPQYVYQLRDEVMLRLLWEYLRSQLRWSGAARHSNTRVYVHHGMRFEIVVGDRTSQSTYTTHWVLVSDLLLWMDQRLKRLETKHGA